jgi:hypothetical protein
MTVDKVQKITAQTYFLYYMLCVWVVIIDMVGATSIYPNHPDLWSAYDLLFDICGEMKRRAGININE